MKYGNYGIIISFTNDKIKESSLDKKISTVYFDNTLYENELKFIANKKVDIFAKDICLTNCEFELLQEYKATFDEDENNVKINRPILNESFIITILVGKEGKLNNYSLCNSDGKSESWYKGLTDYVKTFQTKTDKEISLYIDFPSFGYKEGDDFDLLIYDV